MPNTELELDPTNWVWAQCLAFPANKPNDLQFSSKPYKLRYRSCRWGTWLRTRLSPNPVINYTGHSAESTSLYYHPAGIMRRFS